MTAREALRGILARQMETLDRHAKSARDGENPESIHQMRVAIRRMRAALRLFRKFLPADERLAATEDLRWLASALGAVRDRDVFLEWLNARETCDAAVRSILDRIQARVADERACELRALAQALDSPEYARLKARVAACAGATTPDGTPPFLQSVCKRLRREWRSARKSSKRLKKTASAADYHEFRIEMKRLRYGLEFVPMTLGEALPPKTERKTNRWIKKFRAIQDLLGAANDATVHAARIQRILGADTRSENGSDASNGAVESILEELRRTEIESLRAFRQKRRGLFNRRRGAAMNRYCRKLRSITTRKAELEAPSANGSGSPAK